MRISSLFFQNETQAGFISRSVICLIVGQSKQQVRISFPIQTRPLPLNFDCELRRKRLGDLRPEIVKFFQYLSCACWFVCLFVFFLTFIMVDISFSDVDT